MAIVPPFLVQGTSWHSIDRVFADEVVFNLVDDEIFVA
jgi:hypothetical protein